MQTPKEHAERIVELFQGEFLDVIPCEALEKEIELAIVTVACDSHEEYKNIEAGLRMSGLMLHPGNQPPQFSPEEALDVIEKASESLEKIRQGAV